MSKRTEDESDEELNRQLEAIESGEYDTWLEKAAEANEWNEEEHFGSGESSEDEGKDGAGSGDLWSYPQPPHESAHTSKTNADEVIRTRTKSFAGSKEESREVDDERTTWKDKHDAAGGINAIFSYKEEVGGERPWKFLCAAELEERRRSLANLDHQLKIQGMAHKEKKHALNKRWEKVYSKQLTLINVLRKCEQVKSDCQEKRRRAQEAYFVEKYETGELLKRVKDGERELNHLSHLLVKCQERLEKNQIFKNFMKQVQGESAEEFKTIRQIPDRAHNLQVTRHRLVDCIAQNHADIRTAIQALHHAIQTSRRNILKQSGILSGLLKINGSISEALATIEQRLDVTHMRTRNQSTVIGQIQLSINNLYIELSKQLGLQPTIQPLDPVGQLKSITSFMKQLKHLYKDIRVNAQAGSDNVAIEVDTQALLKERLKYKL